MYNRITAVVLFVQDFPKCLAFYRDQVGLEVVQEEPHFAAFKMFDQDFALLTLENGADMVGLDVESFEAQTGRGDRAMLCTRVDDVDKAYETLRARGVVFTKAPVDQFWGIRAAYFRDPEGNIWEIAHPLASD